MLNRTGIWRQKTGSVHLDRRKTAWDVHSPSCDDCSSTPDEDRTRKKRALRVGFEPTREDPIGFLVQRLNHSAIAALLTRIRTEYEFLSRSHDFHRRTLPYNQTARIVEHGDVVQVHIEPIVSTHRREKIDFITI